MYAKSRYSEPVERYQVWGKGEKEALKKKDAPKEKKPAPNKEKAPKKKAESKEKARKKKAEESAVVVVDDDTDEDSDREVEWTAISAAKAHHIIIMRTNDRKASARSNRDETTWAAVIA